MLKLNIWKKLLKIDNFLRKCTLIHLRFSQNLVNNYYYFLTVSKKMDFSKGFECNFVYFLTCTLHPALVENGKFLNKNLTLQVCPPFCLGIFNFFLIWNLKSICFEQFLKKKKKTDPTHNSELESRFCEKSHFFMTLFFYLKKIVFKKYFLNLSLMF